MLVPDMISFHARLTPRLDAWLRAQTKRERKAGTAASASAIVRRALLADMQRCKEAAHAR